MTILNRIKLKDIIASNWFLFSSLIAIAIVFTLFYMVMTGNQPQVFTDITMEWESNLAGNKSAEMRLIYLLSLGGIIITFLHQFLFKNHELPIKQKPKISKIIFYTISIICLIQIFWVQKTMVLFGTLLVYTAIIYRCDADNLVEDLILPFVTLYLLYALDMFGIFIFGVSPFSYVVAISVAFISSLIYAFIKPQKLFLQRYILLSQLLTPFLLMVYLKNRYQIDDKIVEIFLLPRMYIFVFLIIISCLLESLHLIQKYWNKKTELTNIISIGLCISIVGFHIFSNAGTIISLDLRHPYENIIGFHQIFEMGSIPYKEYIPISGMYSVFVGAFFKLLGKGLMSFYSITEDLLFLSIAITVIFLLSRHINRIWLFFMAVFLLVFHFNLHVWGLTNASNRILFVLPIMLLLSNEKLIKNRNLWLQTYLLTSLFHGLYYTLYGFATACAFLPLGVYQLYYFVKTGELKSQIKTFKFWLVWILCLLPVFLSLPLLAGMLKHTLAMSSQTITTDGITRFAQTFGTYALSEMSIVKSILTYLMTFMLPALFIWLVFYYALNTTKFRKFNGEEIQKLFLIISIVILVLISLSYTMVGLVPVTIFSRNEGLLIAGTVMLLVLFYRFSLKDSKYYWLIPGILIILSFSPTWGVMNDKYKLQPYYYVYPDFVDVQNMSKYKLGTGFIHVEMYRDITDICDKIDKNKTYFAKGTFLAYYMCDIKGDSSLEALTIRGHKSFEENKNMLLKHHTVVGTHFNPLLNYYLYRWLLTSGNYIYSPDTKEFIPNTKYSKGEVLSANKKFNISESYDKTNILITNFFEVLPNALGKSISSLGSIFSNVNTDHSSNIHDNYVSIEFPQNIEGYSSDFLYIELADDLKDLSYTLWTGIGKARYYFDYDISWRKYFTRKEYNPDKRIVVSWSDEEGKTYEISAELGNGRLLMPLGAGDGWLLNKHKFINLSIVKDNKNIEFPQIKKLEFLKLKEV